MKNKTLCTLLYDSYFNFSYFFIALKYIPVLKKGKNYDLTQYSGVLDKFMLLLPYKYHDERNKEIVKNGVCELLDYHTRNIKAFGSRKLSNFASFMDLYRNYLSLYFKDLKPYLIGKKKETWYGFCAFIEKETQISIRDLK